MKNTLKWKPEAQPLKSAHWKFYQYSRTGKAFAVIGGVLTATVSKYFIMPTLFLPVAVFYFSYKATIAKALCPSCKKQFYSFLNGIGISTECQNCGYSAIEETKK